MTTQSAVVPQPIVRPAAARKEGPRKLPLGRQLVLQLICLLIAATVLFPILWIVSMAVDPRNIARPEGLNLIPPGASLDAFGRVIAQPTQNPVTFIELARNSLFIAVLIAMTSVGIGVLAAYAFSRLRFRGREALMIAVLAVLMLPAVAALAPLFVMLTKVQIGDFNLRKSLLGVALAVVSGQLPFAIWNMKGYLDTIPRDLEEAARVDGAGHFDVFWRVILPLSTPVLAVTAFFGFIAGWTEFFFSWVFLEDPKTFTLAMALNGMVGQYSGNTPWSSFAALSILVALPVSVVYLFLPRYIISGLTIGGVKG
ncbi:MAG: arabinogalactan oligomer / maltooligosaccharide transport system permease protein [Chloroflexota bacterium]|nr:arabinogalactan oligomer / maltooligosaccharide transport system permease protein [Chloroflexota bacterium]